MYIKYVTKFICDLNVVNSLLVRLAVLLIIFISLLLFVRVSFLIVRCGNRLLGQLPPTMLGLDMCLQVSFLCRLIVAKLTRVSNHFVHRLNVSFDVDLLGGFMIAFLVRATKLPMGRFQM